MNRSCLLLIVIARQLFFQKVSTTSLHPHPRPNCTCWNCHPSKLVPSGRSGKTDASLQSLDLFVPTSEILLSSSVLATSSFKGIFIAHVFDLALMPIYINLGFPMKKQRAREPPPQQPLQNLYTEYLYQFWIRE